MTSKPPPASKAAQALRQRLLRYVANRLKRASSAEHEDIVQEVLLLAHRSPSPPGADEWGWHVGIAKHEIYHWLGGEIRRLSAEAGAQGPDVDSSGPSAQEAYEAAERRRVVRDFLQSLPAGEREVVIARFGEGEKVPAIAARLGINVHTGYARASNGRDRFVGAVRRYLAKHRLKREELSVPVALLSRLHDEDAVAGAEPVPEERISGSSLQVGGASGVSFGLRAVGPSLAFAAAVAAAVCLWPGQARSGAIEQERTAAPLAAASTETDPPAPMPPAAPATHASTTRTLEARERSEPVPRRPEAPAERSSPIDGAASSPIPRAPAERSKELSWAARIAALRRRGAVREADVETTAFHEAYPTSGLLLARPPAPR